MSRKASLLAFSLLVCGCESETSASDKKRQEEEEAISRAETTLRFEINEAIQSLNATPLVPDDHNWEYRLHVQDHLSTLQERNVHAEIEVRDVVRTNQGIVVSGEADVNTSSLIVDVRLHGIEEATARSIERFDTVVCIGEHTSTVPTSFYLEPHASGEYDVEVGYSVMPLVVDITCSRAWISFR